MHVCVPDASPRNYAELTIDIMYGCMVWYYLWAYQQLSLNFSRGSLLNLLDSIYPNCAHAYTCVRMAALNEFEGFVREKIEVEKFTHKKLSETFQQIFPGDRGFRVRSIKRFCNENSIRKTTSLDNQELDEVVAQAVTQVHVWCDASRPSINIHN